MKRKTKILIKYKLKEIFYLLRLHLIIPKKFLSLVVNLCEVSQWISQKGQYSKNDFYSTKRDYKKRYDLYEFVIEKEQIKENIDYFEFGVASGNSFKWWLEKITDENSRFYGFDTFTGLPENWGPFKKGDMRPEGEIPKFNDPRYTFIDGLFQNTLHNFLDNYQSTKRKIIHLDSDLYSSTCYVLYTFLPKLNKNDILLFDEFNVPEHEFKAFNEWVSVNYKEYEVIGSTNNYLQVAIKLL